MESAAVESAVAPAPVTDEPTAVLVDVPAPATVDIDPMQQINGLKKELEAAQSLSPIDYTALLATLSRLQSLDQHLITASVLQQTQIGVVVNRLSRSVTGTPAASENIAAAVREAAKSIIAQWKDKVKARVIPVTSSPPSTTTSIAALASSSSSSSSSSLSSPSSSSSAPSIPTTVSSPKPALAASSAKGGSVSSASSTAPSTTPKRKTDTNGTTDTPQPKKSKPTITPSTSSSASPSKATAPPPPAPVRTSSASSAASLSPPSTPGGSSSGGGSEEKFVLGATRDSVRNKIQQLLFEAIGGSAGPWETELAVRIERAIYAQHHDTNAAYKTKYRELAMNLKDASNPDLNDALLCAAYSPEQVVAMSVKELASKQLKEQRQAEAQWAAQEARSDLGKLNGLTDMFRCGKCRERKCTYYQMQTRSADEPMTVFVRCTVCGNRWKM